MVLQYKINFGFELQFSFDVRGWLTVTVTVLLNYVLFFEFLWQYTSLHTYEEKRRFTLFIDHVLSISC